jgi:hypothetical protein
VWNVGNATYSGTPVVRAYRTTDGKIPIYLGYEMVVRSTPPVTIRPGRSAKVIVGFESYTGGVEFVLVLTLDGQDDPTANQFVTGIVHYRGR